MPQTVRSFRDLVVWQKAMDLAVAVYRITRDFPSEKLYGLTSQIRRAAVSIASNIAEGQARNTTIDFVRYLGVAKGSLQEVQTPLELSCRLCYVDETQHQELQSSMDEVSKLLNGLVRSLTTDH